MPRQRPSSASTSSDGGGSAPRGVPGSARCVHDPALAVSSAAAKVPSAPGTDSTSREWQRPVGGAVTDRRNLHVDEIRRHPERITFTMTSPSAVPPRTLRSNSPPVLHRSSDAEPFGDHAQPVVVHPAARYGTHRESLVTSAAAVLSRRSDGCGARCALEGDRWCPSVRWQRECRCGSGTWARGWARIYGSMFGLPAPRSVGRASCCLRSTPDDTRVGSDLSRPAAGCQPAAASVRAWSERRRPAAGPGKATVRERHDVWCPWSRRETGAVKRAPTDDPGDAELAVGAPKMWAAGVPAVLHSAGQLVSHMKVGKAVRTMLRINQPDGFDCPRLRMAPSLPSVLRERCQGDEEATSADRHRVLGAALGRAA